MRLAIVMFALMASVTARANSRAACKENVPGLAARAKVSCETATKAALARVPRAKVQSAELEEENGRLVYSFDLRRSHAKGVEEVQVDASSGAVVSIEHEDAAAETKEKAAEHKQP